MANILEFLRGVLTDSDAQSAFRTDPAGHLEQSGFGDLTGEDVVEGVAVLRRSLPEDVASTLAPFDDEDLLPPVRPGNDESELDAAVRVLLFAADRVPVAGSTPATETQPEAETEAETEAEAEAEAEPAPEAEQPAPEPEEAAGDDAGREPEPAPSGAVGAPLTPSAPVTVDVSTLPSVAAFAESMAAVASDARDRFDEAIRQVVADAEVQARDVATKYEDLLRQAEVDANDIRAASDEYAAGRRAEADADRETARQYLDRTREESDAMLERARQQADDLRAQADALLAGANAEVEASRAEIEARQAEIRDAERQLKERLTGIDSLFRTVLRDDEPADDQ